MVSAVITSLNPGIAEPNETDTRFPRRMYPLEMEMSRGCIPILNQSRWGDKNSQFIQCRQCKQYEQCKLGKQYRVPCFLATQMI